MDRKFDNVMRFYISMAKTNALKFPSQNLMYLKYESQNLTREECIGNVDKIIPCIASRRHHKSNAFSQLYRKIHASIGCSIIIVNPKYEMLKKLRA